MKFDKNKTFALILIFTITAISTLVALPLSNAHDPPQTCPTNAFITTTPQTIGLGQYTTIIVWVDRYSPTAGGVYGQLYPGYTINITKPNGDTQIIGPWTCSSALASDWKVFTPDQVGTYKLVFSWPGTVIVASEVVLSHADINDTMLGDTSEPCYLTVQEEQVPTWSETPLPTDYWTRPINAMNRDWSMLASNWLRGTWLLPGNFQNAGTGPSSAHVLWAEPIQSTSPSSRGYPGGIADAQWPNMQTNINDYDEPWVPPIIMNGIIYYNSPPTAVSSKYGYYAVDLYTGQQLWYKNGTDNGLNNPFIQAGVANSYSYGQQYFGLTQGQMLFYNSANGAGVASYLWMQGAPSFTGSYASNGVWYMLDATTGNLILTLTNVPSGTAAMDEIGDLLIYSYNATSGNFLCWNSTQAIYLSGPTGTNQQMWRPQEGMVINAVNDTAWVNASTTWGTTLDPLLKQALKTPHSGYSMNVTDPSLKGLPGSITILQDNNRVPKQIFGRSNPTTYSAAIASPSADYMYIWLATINAGATTYSPWPTLPNTVNTNLGFTITLNYNKTIQVPVSGLNDSWSVPAVNYDADVFFLENQQTRQEWCYRLSTGDLLWGPTVQKPQIAYYNFGGGSGVAGNVYYGIYLAMDANNYNGQIYAYNVTNGNLLWIYNATSQYPYESAYGANMPLMLSAVCDHMVYVYSSEHSPTNPLWRESYIRCINITDGKEIWKLENFYGIYPGSTGSYGMPIADGYMISWSQYDNLIYCIGKGTSATTVTAPLSGITAGSSFTITGTVSDTSAGAKAIGSKFGFANGVPAVSDESQEAWMEYLYQQQIKPSNATGVPVSLDALDPNGNFVHIGDATSDTNGFYSLAVDTNTLNAGSGTYRVIATFDGTNSYGSSSSESAFTVNSAQPTPSPNPVAVLPPTEMYILAVGVAMVIAIAIVGAVLALMIRKRQ
jgi:hypothetical protein